MLTEHYSGIQSGRALSSLSRVCPQGCSSPIVVKFADTQKDKEQRRLQQQLAQQMQQLNTATWGNLTGLGGLTPQYLAVSAREIMGLCGIREGTEHQVQNGQNLLFIKYAKILFSIHFEFQKL